MQPDELEARRCRKEKNAMAKSPKSRCCKGRCCKVDAVKVKGSPEAVFLILVHTDFPTTQGRYLCPEDKPDS
jgi:hypothetical protein